VAEFEEDKMNACIISSSKSQSIMEQTLESLLKAILELSAKIKSMTLPSKGWHVLMKLLLPASHIWQFVIRSWSWRNIK